MFNAGLCANCCVASQMNQHFKKYKIEGGPLYCSLVLLIALEVAGKPTKLSNDKKTNNASSDHHLLDPLRLDSKTDHGNHSTDHRDGSMTMLMWYPVQWWPQSPTQIHTPLGMCSVTNDQNLIDTADIVVFHMLGHSQSVPHMPRPRGALWAYTTWESPAWFTSAEDLIFVREHIPDINMLITYESFADVPVPYGVCLPYDGSEHDAGHRAKQTVPSPLHTRSKFSVAIITNCESVIRNRRLEELRVLLGRDSSIDIIGPNTACANTPLIP